MARYDNTRRNQYNSTPRKVFDKAMDRQDLRLSRHKEDHRADVNALLQKIIELETLLTLHGIELEVLHKHNEMCFCDERAVSCAHYSEGLE